MIILYIAFAFRKVSNPVNSFYYGLMAVVALIHDVTLPAGVFAVLGHYYGVEVDTLFVTALLLPSSAFPSTTPSLFLTG